MMTLDNAFNLVLYAFEHGCQGDLFVQKAPATTIKVLAKAVLELKNSHTGISYIGTRHGEKLFEVLVTAEEMIKAIDMGEYFKIPSDNRDLNYNKFVEEGNHSNDLPQEYDSHNTERLDVKGMKELLLKLDLFND